MVSNKFLHECFLLDEESGRLFWRERPEHHFKSSDYASRINKRLAGQEAGNVYHARGRSRRAVGIGGRGYFIHRVVYAMAHGLDMADVPDLIDHMDGDSMNNRPGNLRPATVSQNNCNRRSRTDRHKGVYLHRGKRWRAEIYHCGKPINLGMFDDEKDAIAAYRDAALRYHGEFARF